MEFIDSVAEWDKSQGIMEFIDTVAEWDKLQGTMAAKRFTGAIRHVTVEPILFLHFVGENIQQPATNILISMKVCLLQLNFTQDVCKNVTNNMDVDDEVQKYVALFKIYIALIQYLPTILFVLILGAWSDIYGRKTLLALSVSGTALQSFGLLINAVYETASPYYILIATIPEGIGGGSTMLTLAGFSYVSDISTPSHQRTIRMSLLHSMIFFGPPIGFFVGGTIAKKWGNYPPVVINLLFHICCLLYIVYQIQETRTMSRDKVDHSRRRCINMTMALRGLNIKRTIETFKTFVQDRERQKRAMVFLLAIGYCSRGLAVNGQNAVLSLYSKRQFSWNVQQIGLFNSVNAISNLVGASLILPLLLHRRQLSDAKSGIIGIVSASLSPAVFSLSFNYEWMMYLGVCITIMAGTIPSIIRSATSKYVDPSEAGKLLSILAIFDALNPLVATIVFTQVYANTLGSYPGAVFVISALLSIVPGPVFIWMHYHMDKPMVPYNLQEAGLHEETGGEPR